MRQRVETLNTERIATISTGIKQAERVQACVRHIVTDTGVRVVNVEKAIEDLRVSNEAGINSQNGLLHTLVDHMRKAECVF